MSESGTYRIRPAGRHILTIGRDLIQDPHAAVIELVKNAFDADSPDVAIGFERLEAGEYRITVTDHGHGMTRDTVVSKWMVPSTSDKEDRDGPPGLRATRVPPLDTASWCATDMRQSLRRWYRNPLPAQRK